MGGIKNFEVKIMPLLQYKCAKCGEKFEELVKTYTDEVKWSAVRGSAAGAITAAASIPQRVRRAKNAAETVRECGGCR